MTHAGRDQDAVLRELQAQLRAALEQHKAWLTSSSKPVPVLAARLLIEVWVSSSFGEGVAAAVTGAGYTEQPGEIGVTASARAQRVAPPGVPPGIPRSRRPATGQAPKKRRRRSR